MRKYIREDGCWTKEEENDMCHESDAEIPVARGIQILPQTMNFFYYLKKQKSRSQGTRITRCMKYRANFIK